MTDGTKIVVFGLLFTFLGVGAVSWVGAERDAGRQQPTVVLSPMAARAGFAAARESEAAAPRSSYSAEARAAAAGHLSVAEVRPGAGALSVAPRAGTVTIVPAGEFAGAGRAGEGALARLFGMGAAGAAAAAASGQKKLRK